ncbi:MAG: hypothetical protein B9J98_03345 [Candidatus Terraquivivens tikiterensis]|uniref:DUF429 domain-containing protein n=1 Tax=Candidatus Terraquivivens tikiterensis TaxID=1980982 RepID=A0A2R7Y5Z3_9ARCH|nr:MAG: hypothetical protein B9J98_03345 [Candidatus Terraquivivens tikiterensis]
MRIFDVAALTGKNLITNTERHRFVDLKVVGIDLAGSENRPTGFCVMTEDLFAKTCIVYKDHEILDLVKSTMPRVVAVDAPLSLPRGRTSLEVREPYHLRGCDRELLRLGIKFFPITLGPMRRLTERGMRLKPSIEQLGVKVIEVYPGGAQDVLRIPRKRAGLDKLLRGLRRLGIKGLKHGMSGDELDAVTCALVGYLYLRGSYVILGDEEEGVIVMPKPLKKRAIAGGSSSI